MIELALAGLVGLVVCAAGMAFFNWGASNNEVKRNEGEVEAQKAVTDEAVKSAPRGFGLRQWMRDNRKD